MKDFFLVSAKVKEIHRAATLLLLRGIDDGCIYRIIEKKESDDKIGKIKVNRPVALESKAPRPMVGVVGPVVVVWRRPVDSARAGPLCSWPTLPVVA